VLRTTKQIVSESQELESGEGGGTTRPRDVEEKGGGTRCGRGPHWGTGGGKVSAQE
jgi:hypothetical protein